MNRRTSERIYRPKIMNKIVSEVITELDIRIIPENTKKKYPNISIILVLEKNKHRNPRLRHTKKRATI